MRRRVPSERAPALAEVVAAQGAQIACFAQAAQIVERWLDLRPSVKNHRADHRRRGCRGRGGTGSGDRLGPDARHGASRSRTRRRRAEQGQDASFGGRSDLAGGPGRRTGPLGRSMKGSQSDHRGGARSVLQSSGGRIDQVFSHPPGGPVVRRTQPPHGPRTSSHPSTSRCLIPRDVTRAHVCPALRFIFIEEDDGEATRRTAESYEACPRLGRSRAGSGCRIRCTWTRSPGRSSALQEMRVIRV